MSTTKKSALQIALGKQKSNNSNNGKQVAPSVNAVRKRLQAKQASAQAVAQAANKSNNQSAGKRRTGGNQSKPPPAWLTTAARKISQAKPKSTAASTAAPNPVQQARKKGNALIRKVKKGNDERTKDSTTYLKNVSKRTPMTVSAGKKKRRVVRKKPARKPVKKTTKKRVVKRKKVVRKKVVNPIQKIMRLFMGKK